jgi:hypothetical protein
VGEIAAVAEDYSVGPQGKRWWAIRHRDSATSMGMMMMMMMMVVHIRSTRWRGFHVTASGASSGEQRTRDCQVAIHHRSYVTS